MRHLINSVLVLSAIVASSASAADLPAKKTAPAAAASMQGCPAFGAGFFNIPGGETCLKIGGYFRYMGYVQTPDTGITNAAYSQAGRYRLELDARSNSEVGTVRGFARITDNATDRAFVQLGGLTAGAYSATTDIAGIVGETFSALYNDGTNVTGGIKYDAAFGATTVTLGFENAKDQNASSSVSDRPDALIGVKTKLGDLNASIIGVNHHVQGGTSGEAEGYALLSNVGTSVGALAANMWGGVSKGASRYTYSTALAVATWPDSDANAGNLADGANYGGQIVYTAGQVKVASQMSQATLSYNGSKYTSNRYGLAFITTPAPGLTVEPGVTIYQNTDQNASATTTTRAYLQIKSAF